MFLLLLLLALAPCLFLLWYFYYRDRYEPEPKKKILKMFLIGAVMVIPAALIEYVLIKGMNDASSHARELANFLKPLRAKVNIIPLNPSSNSVFARPSDEEVRQFCDWLIAEKVFVRKRSEKGTNILAACGQLGSRGGICHKPKHHGL